MPCLFVKNLCAIDSSTLDTEHGLTGNSWQVDVTLSGQLNQESMIFDFSLVKKTIKQLIDNLVDHKLIIAKNHPNLTIAQCDNTTESVSVSLQLENGTCIRHLSPSSALCILDADSISTQSIEQHIIKSIAPHLPSNIEDVQIHLHSEQLHLEQHSDAFYQYSHGLKKHDGNCQRIAHGHRSKIEIEIDGKRDKQLEAAIAKKWNHIYLATQSDIVQQDEQHTKIEYFAPQGHFQLCLPSQRVHTMQQDSTVECIAEHILQLLCQSTYFGKQYAHNSIQVRAYEGIGKGAISRKD